MTLYFDKVHRVATPAGRQTASVQLSSSECITRGEVCYLRLPCFQCADVAELNCVSYMRVGDSFALLWTKDNSRRGGRHLSCWVIISLLVVLRIAPSRTTARLQPKNHFRFHLTQLLLLSYNFLSTTCNLLRFQQPTPPVPDKVSILKLLQLTTSCTASASRQTG